MMLWEDLNSHVGHTMDWSPEGTFTTEPALRLPETGPVWLNGQGTRGLYCTLPNSPSHAPEYRSAHSDGACYGRWRMQMSAYISDVPPNSGGFTVWPGSHSRIWPEQWKAFKEGEKHTDKHLAVRKAGGYTDPVIGQIKADTNRLIATGPPAQWYCGTLKSCTSQDRTLLTTLSAKRLFTVLRKHLSQFRMHSWWTTQMATSGGIGPMKCVRLMGNVGRYSLRFGRRFSNSLLVKDGLCFIVVFMLFLGGFTPVLRMQKVVW